jgi:hypothetical protein
LKLGCKQLIIKQIAEGGEVPPSKLFDISHIPQTVNNFYHNTGIVSFMFITFRLPMAFKHAFHYNSENKSLVYKVTGIIFFKTEVAWFNVYNKYLIRIIYILMLYILCSVIQFIL